MNIANLSTSDYVYVSVASRSKVAGKLVEVLSVSCGLFSPHQVKVRDQFLLKKTMNSLLLRQLMERRGKLSKSPDLLATVG